MFPTSQYLQSRPNHRHEVVHLHYKQRNTLWLQRRANRIKTCSSISNYLSNCHTCSDIGILGQYGMAFIIDGRQHCVVQKNSCEIFWSPVWTDLQLMQVYTHITLRFIPSIGLQHQRPQQLEASQVDHGLVACAERQMWRWVRPFPVPLAVLWYTAWTMPRAPQCSARGRAKPSPAVYFAKSHLFPEVNISSLMADDPSKPRGKRHCLFILNLLIVSFRSNQLACDVSK